MKEYLYYAHKIGQESYTEDLILVLKEPITQAQQNKLFPLLEADGYDLTSWRMSIFDGAPPNFAATIAS